MTVEIIGLSTFYILSNQYAGEEYKMINETPEKIFVLKRCIFKKLSDLNLDQICL